MAKWTIVYNNGQIAKDNVFYEEIDLSFLPSDILAVQSYDGITCDIERGDRVKEKITGNDDDVPISSLSWWGNVVSAYDAAKAVNDAFEAAEAADIAAKKAAIAAAAEETTP